MRRDCHRNSWDDIWATMQSSVTDEHSEVIKKVKSWGNEPLIYDRHLIFGKQFWVMIYFGQIFVTPCILCFIAHNSHVWNDSYGFKNSYAVFMMRMWLKRISTIEVYHIRYSFEYLTQLTLSTMSLFYLVDSGRKLLRHYMFWFYLVDWKWLILNTILSENL